MNIPYIPKERREEYDQERQELVNKLLPSGFLAPDLTYVIYKLIKELCDREGYTWKAKATALMVLEAVKLEYYDKVIKPYEREAIKKSGDI